MIRNPFLKHLDYPQKESKDCHLKSSLTLLKISSVTKATPSLQKHQVCAFSVCAAHSCLHCRVPDFEFIWRTGVCCKVKGKASQQEGMDLLISSTLGLSPARSPPQQQELDNFDDLCCDTKPSNPGGCRKPAKLAKSKSASLQPSVTVSEQMASSFLFTHM